MGRDTAPLDRALQEYGAALDAIDARRTINKAIGTLRTMLKFAEGRRLVAFDAAARVRMLPWRPARMCRWITRA